MAGAFGAAVGQVAEHRASPRYERPERRLDLLYIAGYRAVEWRLSAADTERVLTFPPGRRTVDPGRR
jgi:hypothetical protein